MVSHLRTWFSRLSEPANYAARAPATFAAAIAEPWGEINAAHPFREGNTIEAYMVWTQLEAACQVAAAETLGAVPPHRVNWERIALILGTTEAEARTAWRLEPHTGHDNQTL
jgi:hypothetical protein